jgi:hypothetical protein
MPNTSASPIPKRQTFTDGEGSTPTPVRLLAYDPELVRRVGANEALLLCQLHYWLQRPGDSGKNHDGHHWIYKTHQEWSDEIGISKEEARRAVDRSLARGVLVSIHNPIKGWDQTPWYRIDYEHPIWQGCRMQLAESPTAIGTAATWKRQSRQLDVAGSPNAVGSTANAIPETTTKSPTESTPENTPERAEAVIESVTKSTGRGIFSELRKVQSSRDSETPRSNTNHGSENPLVVFRHQETSMRRLHNFVRKEEERGTPRERIWTVSDKHNNELGRWEATPKDFLAMVEAA